MKSSMALLRDPHRASGLDGVHSECPNDSALTAPVWIARWSLEICLVNFTLNFIAN
jgi:hypothetical protein